MKTRCNESAIRSLTFSGIRQLRVPTVGSYLLCLLVLVVCGCSQQASIEVSTASVDSPGGPKMTGEKQPSQPSSTQEMSEEELAESYWPTFRGNPMSTGFISTTLPDELNIKWEYKVDNGAFESTAAISGGVVYIGDLDGKLFAFDLETGNVKWEFEAEIGFIAAAAVYNDRVFIGDLDGIFYCVDLNGKELWRHETGAEIDAGANFYKDTVIFGSQDATLYCLKQETGEVEWTHQIDDQIRCSPTIVENIAFVAGCDGVLHMIDLDKGEAKSGVVIDSPTGVTPAVLDDKVYFGTEQAGFFAVDWKKSEVQWIWDDPDGATSTRSNPAVTDGHIIFGAKNRKVNSLSPNGEINWTFETRGPVDSSPVIAGSRVYVGSDDRRFYVLNLSDGELLSERELNGKIIGSPAVANDTLIVATNRGVVYCLGK